ncbi:MAG: hypothetical protein WBB89_20305 [Candidatus Acidiferrum sp.]
MIESEDWPVRELGLPPRTWKKDTLLQAAETEINPSPKEKERVLQKLRDAKQVFEAMR